MRQPDEVTRERADEDMQTGDAIPMPAPGRLGGQRVEDAESDREVERDEGLTPKVRGSSAAPSDRPENRPPHPQDVNEFEQGKRPGTRVDSGR
jgi:hypothetical protein